TGSTTGATSQFYINCGKSENLTDEFYEGLSSSGKVLPANVKAKYNEIGGAPNLDGDYAVFGQVIEGMDIVDKIAATKVDEQSKPLTQIIVETITIEKY
ncbi:MAG: peptidylprolyl isomerase, partial [Oscillospiraceae bacterium]